VSYGQPTGTLAAFKISQIRALSLERIGKLTGKASQEEMLQIIEGLNEIVA
jgi:mRNA interferase MazF